MQVNYVYSVDETNACRLYIMPSTGIGLVKQFGPSIQLAGRNRLYCEIDTPIYCDTATVPQILYPSSGTLGQGSVFSSVGIASTGKR